MTTGTGDWRAHLDGGPPPRSASGLWLVGAIFGVIVLFGLAIWASRRLDDTAHAASQRDRAEIRRRLDALEGRKP